jgi:hypothetical protein
MDTTYQEIKKTSCLVCDAASFVKAPARVFQFFWPAQLIVADLTDDLLMNSFPDNSALLRHSHESALRFQNPTGYRPVATPPWLASSPMSGRGPHAAQRDRRTPLIVSDTAPSRRLPSRSRTQQPPVSRSCVVGERHRAGGSGLDASEAGGFDDHADATITSPPFSEPKVPTGTEPLDEIEQRTSATMKGLRHMYDLLLAPCWGVQSRTPPAILRVVDELRTECERITKNHMKTFETVISAKMVVASAAGYGDDSGDSGGDRLRSPSSSPPREEPHRGSVRGPPPSGGDDGVPRPVAVIAGNGVGGDVGGLQEPESARDAGVKTPSWLHGDGASGSSPKSTPAQSTRTDHAQKQSARHRRTAPPSLCPELIGATTSGGTMRATAAPTGDAHGISQTIAEEFDDDDDDVDSVELSSMSSDDDDPVPSPAVFVRRSVMTPRSRLRRSKQRS